MQTQYSTVNNTAMRTVNPIVVNTAIPSVVSGQDSVSEITNSVDGSTEVTGNVAKVGVVRTEEGVPSGDSRSTLRMLS